MSQLQSLTPLFRMFDEARAREFYVDFLGFSVNWEHRFGPDLPLYMEVARDGVRIHLTGHHGDCCPGAALRVGTRELDTLLAELTEKNDRHARPGIDEPPWGGREMSVTDPFGNRITFFES